MHAEPESTAHSPSSELLVTVAEAARRLAVGRTTLYQQIRHGVIPSVRVGHSRRVAVIDLQRYVDDLRESANSDAHRSSP
jgi:excisionase family DNA binding protein